MWVGGSYLEGRALSMQTMFARNLLGALSSRSSIVQLLRNASIATGSMP